MIARRRPIGSVLVLALAVLGPACASTPPPSASPGSATPGVTGQLTPTPTPTPSPSPLPSPTKAPGTHSLDNQVDLAGLRHDSRDLLYRTPGAAVPAGTSVQLRLRAFHGDVSGVKLRVFSVNSDEEQLIAMTQAAADVSCYEAALVDDTCDFWQATLGNAEPDNLWYRFIVSDGTATAYYADDTPALDGGVGAASAELVDNSYALMVYVPDFAVPAWASNTILYQIFPDRFRNGDTSNDPKTGDQRYDEPVLKLAWSDLPEGYCRGYVDSETNCPWRFEDNPPSYSPTVEGPRGRDYMGGDLAGVTAELDYLQSLGVTAIYLNPIFDAGSNHGYDTQDYSKVDPYFGSEADFSALVAAAKTHGMKIILDGVFNHMSSDSPFFDRYGHYDSLGACESNDSPWRLWFTFTLGGVDGGPCAAPGGPGRMVYDSWFGFDSIPTINKTREEVLDYFVNGADSVARQWLARGASGWRMDVSGDPSFPDGYWEAFRERVKPLSHGGAITRIGPPLLISETWQKDTALLRALRGDRFDTTMNYRLRDAVLGLLTPTTFDAKGFPDSGRSLSPTEFAQRLLSMQEDYPSPAYHALMNLLDSHDTERALWALTPGDQTTAGRETDPANVAEGKQRLKLASLIQFTVPGMPSVYYGDEVGMTGQTDPDDRRTYPWADLGGTPDSDLMAHYQAVARLRTDVPALNTGDLRILLADDANGTVAYGRRSADQAVVVAVNGSDKAQTLTVPVAGFVPNGTSLPVMYETAGVFGEALVVEGGQLQLQLEPLSGIVLATTGSVDLAPPAAPEGVALQSEGNGQVSIAWQPSGDAAGYNVYRSPLTGGGWVKVNDAPLTETSFTDTGVANAKLAYYSVTAVDAAGNESPYSIETGGMAHVSIDSAVLTGPTTLTQTISAIHPTEAVRGQVTVISVETIQAQIGFGPAGSPPADNPAWTWVDAPPAAVGASEFSYILLPDHTGTFDYVYRFTSTAGREWVYADLSGIFTGVPAQPGKLTVNPSFDTSAPPTPTALKVLTASILGVDLQWDAVADDSLYGYEVARSDDPPTGFTPVGLVTVPAFHDPNVTSTSSIYYVVRAVDTSFNRSPDSAAVEAKPGPRPVTIVFNLTVPVPTGPAVGRDVYIAGYLDRLDPTLPQWDPAGVVMTNVDDTHWSVTLHGIEGTSIGYKYVLGDWNYVEKDASCAEISDRPLTVSFGQDGTQVVEDVVENWRNVDTCPN